MKKHNVRIVTLTLALILSCGSVSSCSSTTSATSRFDLYPSFDEAYQFLVAHPFDYSEWVGFNYLYYFDGYETYLNDYFVEESSDHLYGQETDLETIVATNIDGMINGHEELDVQHWDTYIGGSQTGSYYDGTTLYLKTKKDLTIEGDYDVSKSVRDLNFRYYSEVPFGNVDSAISRFIGYGQDGEHLVEIGYILSGELNENKEGYSITLEADVIQEDYMYYYGDPVPGIIVYDIILTLNYDENFNPISLVYDSSWDYDYYIEYETEGHGYQLQETYHIEFEKFEGVVDAPDWIYE